MSKILEALEKSYRERNTPVVSRAGSARERQTARALTLVPSARTVVLDRGALLRAGWVSALEPSSPCSRPFASLAEHLRTRVPAPARILVCGVTSGAGATSASLNLATEIALSGSATALWCEIPGQSDRLRAQLGPTCSHGLWDHLHENVRLRDVLLRTQVQRLVLLPGQGHDTPALSPPTLEDVDRVLLEIRNRYLDRYVVVDAPPPSASRLTAGLASRFDGAVLVVPAGIDRELVLRAQGLLSSCPVVAVLLNRTPGCLLS